MANTLISADEMARGIIEKIKLVAEENNVPLRAVEISTWHGFGGQVSEADLDWAEEQLKGINLPK